MNQGRNQVEVEVTNRLMVSFLIAIILFTTLTFTIRQLAPHFPWMIKLEKSFLKATRASNSVDNKN